MYAVIRAGGKQYRVAPGDVIRVEKQPQDGSLEFEVLAVSAGDGQIARPGDARVIGQVMEQGRADKILVFHYKRKKQYKKLAGHRQPYTAVRITEIAFDGQNFTAPALQARKPKATEGGAAPPAAVKPGRKVRSKAAQSGPSDTSAGSATKAQFGGSTKLTGSKTKGGRPPAPKKK